MTPKELKALRKQTQLTREQFAVLVLGVTGKTVYNWERGKRPIPGLHDEGIRAKVREFLAPKP